MIRSAASRGFAAHQPFSVAREFARSLKLKSKDEWRAYVRAHGLPPGIPIRPGQVYRGTWEGWPDFLGYLPAKGRTLPSGIWSYRKARALVREQEFSSSAEFLKWARRGATAGVPRAPEDVYGNAWRGWRDFLGKSYYLRKGAERWPYAKARAYVRKLGLTSRTEFVAWSHSKARPPGFPLFPYNAYGKEWGGWGDFLGKTYLLRQGGRPPRQHTVVSFEAVRAAARKAGVENSTQYIAWVTAQPVNAGFPRYLAKVYPDQWKGWDLFLGENYHAHTRARRERFRLVRLAVKQQRISSREEYLQAAKKSANPVWPVDPEQYFAGIGWRGWRHFLNLKGGVRGGRPPGRRAGPPQILRIAALRALGEERVRKSVVRGRPKRVKPRQGRLLAHKKSRGTGAKSRPSRR